MEGMTNLGTGGEAGGVTDADREDAETDIEGASEAGVRPDGGRRVTPDDLIEEVDPTGV